MLHAVVCGINSYSDARIGSLRYACADAESFANSIEQSVDGSDLQLTLLLNRDATRKKLMVTIGEDLHRHAKSDDLVLLYFACHGSSETPGRLDDVGRYLVVHDTEFDHIYSTGIDMQRDLIDWFSRLPSKLVLLFLDACFSGMAGGRTFRAPRLRRVLDEFRGGPTLRLKDLDLGEGRIMIAACKDDQVAREEERLNHGVFTYFLLRAMKRSRTNEHTISLNRLYDEVALAVRNHTEGLQVPVFNGQALLASLPTVP